MLRSDTGLGQEEFVMNQSERFLNEIDDLAKREIPEEVMQRAKQSLVDYLAVASAGAKFQEEKLEKYVSFAEPEEGKYTAIGIEKKLALKEAVFLNGLNGHALDFDDGTNSGIIHLGSPIFSLLLPLAEKYGKTTDELLRAAVIGYETSYTLAVSIQPDHKAMGYHATGTCGTVGASIAACYFLGFSEEERKNAFAAACAAASGVLKVLDEGSELKPYNAAKTALLALTSIELAKAGFVGPSDPLGGRGFLRMMTGKEAVELKPLLLNGTYAIRKTYTKPYASCRYTHPSIEAAVKLTNENGIRAEDIREINIKTYALAVSGHDHVIIPGAYSAKMSIPYSVAAGIIYGKAGLQEFEESVVKKPDVLALTQKVRVAADDALSESFPRLQSAFVEICTDQGRFTKRVDFPKGEPENPLTENEFRMRYAGLMAYAGTDAETADKLYDSVFAGNRPVSDILSLFHKEARRS